MESTTIPLRSIGIQVGICLLAVALVTFLMEKRKNPARLAEDASSMYLCGETERVVVHNRAYRIRVMKSVMDERLERMVLYLLLILATMVVIAWISLPRLW